MIYSYCLAFPTRKTCFEHAAGDFLLNFSRFSIFILCFFALAKVLAQTGFIEEKGEKENIEIKQEMKSMLEDREVDRIQKEKEEPRISNKWFRGSNLIYDCENGHYACVNEVSFYRCQRERQEDKEENRSGLRCSPFKSFKTQKKCFEKQYKIIHNQLPKMFCINPKFL
jgi:hypothetical protein